MGELRGCASDTAVAADAKWPIATAASLVRAAYAVLTEVSVFAKPMIAQSLLCPGHRSARPTVATMLPSRKSIDRAPRSRGFQLLSIIHRQHPSAFFPVCIDASACVD